jgi:hypothetical protein
MRARAREAARLLDIARGTKAAADYEAAAALWSRVAASTKGQPAQQARFRLAEARFRAWEAGPSAARAHAASEALMEYLRYATPGSQRDQAARWLARVLR